VGDLEGVAVVVVVHVDQGVPPDIDELAELVVPEEPVELLPGLRRVDRVAVEVLQVLLAEGVEGPALPLRGEAQDHALDAAIDAVAGGLVELLEGARRIVSVGPHERVDPERQLGDRALHLRLLAALARVEDHRGRDRGEARDDGDDDEQLDQGEPIGSTRRVHDALHSHRGATTLSALGIRRWISKESARNS